jgi:DNA invertase Pin-like site-specific DNA recombinase
MSRSALVTAQHLARNAVISIRQSSPHQVRTQQESLRPPYALQPRALPLGGRPEEIAILDADVGRSAPAAQHRQGCQAIVPPVPRGPVGRILSAAVTRLSRNCSDWYPRRDICGDRRALMADRAGPSAPATPHGRLLLGRTGPLSERERYTSRARLTAGLLKKAPRGELALQLPVGLWREALHRVHNDPALEVQHRIALLCTPFLPRPWARKGRRFCNDQQVTMPRRDGHGGLVWKKPTVAALIAPLKDPADAGALVYGRTRQGRKASAPHAPSQQRSPSPQWTSRVNDQAPASLSGETLAKLPAMLQDTDAESDRRQTRGIPRPGAALLPGLVYGGEGGHHMRVRYQPSTRCLYPQLRQQDGVPLCQYIPADPIDAWVVEAFFQALSPLDLEAEARAMAAPHQASGPCARASPGAPSGPRRPGAAPVQPWGSS